MPTPLRLRRKQMLQEAEGYLDLLLGFADQWPLPVDVRNTVAERGLATLDRIKEPGPDRAKLLYLRGQMLRVLEKYEQAVAPLAAAADLDPESVQIHLALGWCYKRIGRLDRAIESLEAILQVDRSEAIVYYNLACYWSVAGDKRKAIDYLARALDMDTHYRELIDQEPDFDALRSDPEFQSLTSVIV